ncbi:MAG: translocation/assembly module TamB domain-containing protein [Candidatus Omnitrophota bacterium]
MLKLNKTTYNITLTLAITLFIFSAGLFYINKILLPIQIKDLAIKTAQDTLKRHVTFDTLQYSPIHGFVISNITIYQKDDPKKIFVHAKSISAQILFFALVQRKVIIPALDIQSPEVFITRLDPQTWNFSDLLTTTPNATPPTSATPAPELIISGFNISNGLIHLTDISQGEPFKETIGLPVLKGSLALNSDLHISGNLALTSTSGTLNFDARIGLIDKSFKSTLAASNIMIPPYLRFLPAPLPLSLKQLTISSANITILSQPEKTTITGEITLPAININLADTTQCQGDISLSKIVATQNKTGLSAQALVRGSKLQAILPSGMNASLGTLSLPNLQASLNNNRLNITTDIGAKELSLQWTQQQNLQGNLDVRNFSLVQTDKGFTLNANLDADNLSLALNETQHITGHLNLTRATVSIADNGIELKTDAEIRNAAFNMPGTSVTASILAPDVQISLHDAVIESTLKAAFNDLIVKTQEITAAGTPRLTAHLKLDPAQPVPVAYAGTLEIPSLTVTGIPRAGTINNIRQF